MKKLLLLLLSAFVLSACVDKDFDLGDINTDELTFGDEFIAPIGNIELKLSDVLDFGDNRLKSGAVPVLIPEEFSSSFNLNGGFDQGIVDALTSSGSQSIEAEIIHSIPNVKLLLNLSFLNGEEQTTVIKDQPLASGGGKTSVSVDITKEMMAKVATAQALAIEFKVREGANQSVMLDPNDAIIVNLKLKRKGGLKF